MRNARLVLVAGVLAASGALAACSSEPDEGESSAIFALTEADVMVPAEQDYEVQVPFLADPADPIWAGLPMVGIPGGPHLVGPEATTPIKSGTRDGKDLGSFSFSILPELLPLTFDTLNLYYAGEDKARSMDIGQWTLVAGEENPEIVEVSGVSAASSCASISGTFTNNSSETLTSVSAETMARGIELQSTIVPEEVASGEEFDLTLDMTCDDSADYRIVSPEVSFATENSPITTRVGWLSVDFADEDAFPWVGED